MLTFHYFSLQALVLFTFQLYNGKLPLIWNSFRSITDTEKMLLWPSKSDVFLHETNPGTKDIVAGSRYVRRTTDQNDVYWQAVQSHAKFPIIMLFLLPLLSLTQMLLDNFSCSKAVSTLQQSLSALLVLWKPLPELIRVFLRKFVMAYRSRDRKHSSRNWKTMKQLTTTAFSRDQKQQNTGLSGVMGRDLATVLIHTRWTVVDSRQHLRKKA